MIILVPVSCKGKLQKESVWLRCMLWMYAHHLALAAPIHLISVKKEAELRPSDSVMLAVMCSCEIQVQWPYLGLGTHLQVW